MDAAHSSRFRFCFFFLVVLLIPFSDPAHLTVSDLSILCFPLLINNKASSCQYGFFNQAQSGLGRLQIHFDSFGVGLATLCRTAISGGLVSREIDGNSDIWPQALFFTGIATSQSMLNRKTSGRS
jgi:hypothetical protein